MASGKIPDGVELIGFDHKWINADFNPDGMRVCFFNNGEWISAFWNDYHDTYQNSNDVPFLYRPMPASPMNTLKLCPVCNEDVDPASICDEIKGDEKIKSKKVVRSEEMSEPEKIRINCRDGRKY